MQPLYLAGASVSLAMALSFLSFGVSIMIKIGNPKRIHAIIFFILGCVFIILFTIFWQAAFTQTNQTPTLPITPQELNNMWPLWLSAIGTIALALVTFIISIVIPWIKKPKFEVEFDNTIPYCREAPVIGIIHEDGSTTDLPPDLISTKLSYWLRLKVINSGNSVAKRCIGKIVKVMDDSGKEITNYDPVMLHWVGTNWAALPFIPIDLNQGEYEFLDILVTANNVSDKVYLCTDSYLRGTPKYLPPGTYRIQVTIYGDGVTPFSKQYKVIWGASHYRDIKIEELKKL